MKSQSISIIEDLYDNRGSNLVQRSVQESSQTHRTAIPLLGNSVSFDLTCPRALQLVLCRSSDNLLGRRDISSRSLHDHLFGWNTTCTHDVGFLLYKHSHILERISRQDSRGTVYETFRKSSACFEFDSSDNSLLHTSNRRVYCMCICGFLRAELVQCRCV